MVGLAVDSQFAQHPYLYLTYTHELSPLTPDSSSPAVAQLLRLRINSANQLTEETVILGTYLERALPAGDQHHRLHTRGRRLALDRHGALGARRHALGR